MNFLEVLLYHRSACEAADDTLVELIDYCYRKFSAMVQKCEQLPEGQSIWPDHKPTAQELINETKDQEMET